METERNQSILAGRYCSPILTYYTPCSVPSQGEEDPEKLKCITYSYSYIANQEIIKEYAKIIQTDKVSLGNMF